MRRSRSCYLTRVNVSALSQSWVKLLHKMFQRKVESRFAELTWRERKKESLVRKLLFKAVTVQATTGTVSWLFHNLKYFYLIYYMIIFFINYKWIKTMMGHSWIIFYLKSLLANCYGVRGIKNFNTCGYWVVTVTLLHSRSHHTVGLIFLPRIVLSISNPYLQHPYLLFHAFENNSAVRVEKIKV